MMAVIVLAYLVGWFVTSGLLIREAGDDWSAYPLMALAGIVWPVFALGWALYAVFGERV